MMNDTRLAPARPAAPGYRPRGHGPSKRSFLFLQGLAGPFFNQLGDALAARDHAVHRVNFHGGDLVYWRRPGAVNYRGTLSDWPEFLERLIEARAVTDIILFGDCRPLHKEAIGVARQMHVQVHVFEEGYIRPDWVTLEVGGVNGHSSLPRDPEYYLDAARLLPPVPTMPPVAASFGRRAREDVIYNVSAMLLMAMFLGYRTHRPWPVLVEYAGWIRKLAGKRAAQARARAALDRLHADGRAYFVFPLQLNCDYQIRAHSEIGGMKPAIEQILGSFAAYAPADTLLVVKAHPLENGLHDWRGVTLAAADRLGIGERLIFLEEGDIGALVRGSCGLVTVNSTTGTLALAEGVPVITLGRAVYDIRRVTYQYSLDSFWTTRTPPDLDVWEAFRRVLVHRCLVHGGFFSDEGRARLVAAAADRLCLASSKAATVMGPELAPALSGPVLAGARG
jgi:capsular polysaccharide export protein